MKQFYLTLSIVCAANGALEMTFSKGTSLANFDLTGFLQLSARLVVDEVIVVVAAVEEPNCDDACGSIGRRDFDVKVLVFDLDNGLSVWLRVEKNRDDSGSSLKNIEYKSSQAFY